MAGMREVSLFFFGSLLAHAQFFPKLAVMTRGKRTVFAAFCSETGFRIGSFRFHKQDKRGKAWKEHAEKLVKFCSDCRKRVKVKLKEERHSA